MASEGEIKQRFFQLEAWLDERARRLWAAAESAAHGRGGISLMARASGISYERGTCPVTELMFRQQLMYTDICRAGLTEEDADDVVTAIEKVLGNADRLAKAPS